MEPHLEQLIINFRYLIGMPPTLTAALSQLSSCTGAQRWSFFVESVWSTCFGRHYWFRAACFCATYIWEFSNRKSLQHLSALRVHAFIHVEWVLTFQNQCAQAPDDPQVFTDGSSVAKRPTELTWLFAPEKGKGVFAAPVVRNPSVPRGLSWRNPVECMK